MRAGAPADTSGVARTGAGSSARILKGSEVASTALDGQAQIRGKCQYWRERMDEYDRWDRDVRPADKRVTCSCFVEGRLWAVTVETPPADCPERDRCRYHIPMY